ncbi:glucans biosynthesis protein MdoC, partial [Salmonella enterica]|nr:glucans biosynthesis protein MdoC [Salmonella enterica]
MSSVPAPREYFLDSIRAWLMLLGIPFHISLIYSTHSWHVNSATPSWCLTLFNDFIHAFRMQVFFVISGYFSYMLFLRYPLKRWWKVRVERVGIPMLTAIPLLTLPQFILLQYVKEKTENWPMLSAYEKYNTLAWELISHLWFLLVLVILTTVSIGIFTWFQKRQETSKPRPAAISLAWLSLIFFLLGMAYAAIRRIIFIVYPAILSDGMFNFIVMQTLFYVPFFILGALSFIHPDLKARFTTPSRGCTLGAAVAFIAYLLNQRYGSGDAWMYETESVITMVMGLWMVNVVFSLGHRLLNFQSARVTYFVNASLFIYLVHHPLTLFFGAYITPHISSNLIGFLCG